MTLAYYTTPLSDNIEETPEGYLICRDVPIARTGWQTYTVGELPKQMAEDAGIDTSNPHASVDLYRHEDDVFSPETLASFEGKPVCDDHPEDFVAPENYALYAKGHVQNVRKGSQPLDSGEWPIVADVHVTAEPLLSKVRNRIKREVSCAYDYNLEREGEKVLQKDITGNHVAVVPKGRAGPEARISDSASVTAATSTSTIQPKEKKPVAITLKRLIGLGLKAFAVDAEPEDLAAAAEAIHKEPADQTGDVTDRSRHADDAGGGHADDRRSRMHDALDRLLDGGECDPALMGAMDRGARDSDLEELRGLLDNFFEEEEGEATHAADEEEEIPAEGEEVTEESGEEEVAEDNARAADSARRTGKAKGKDAVDGALVVLKGLRPVIARCKDKAVQDAFNTALSSINGRSRATNTGGGYGRFAATARDREPGRRTIKPAAVRAAAAASSNGRVADAAPSREQKMQEYYNNAFKEGK